MINLMSAGNAAEVLTLATNEIKDKILSAVMGIIRVDNP
jgi:hypothetical protein